MENKTEEKFNIPYPQYQEIPIFSNCSCLRSTVSRYRENCYFYDEEVDMGGHIPVCNYHKKLGYCPCEGCKKYTAKSEVYGMVMKLADKKED